MAGQKTISTTYTPPLIPPTIVSPAGSSHALGQWTYDERMIDGNLLTSGNSNNTANSYVAPLTLTFAAPIKVDAFLAWCNTEFPNTPDLIRAKFYLGAVLLATVIVAPNLNEWTLLKIPSGHLTIDSVQFATHNGTANYHEYGVTELAARQVA